MFGFKHGRLGSAGTRTLIQRAIASLRARGSDAHLWLPGVGTINGLTTGNYLESTGNTLATVNNPTGLVLDALGTVGAELVTNGGFDSDTGWAKGTGWTIAGGVASAVAATSNLSKSSVAPSPTGKTYRVTLSVLTLTGGSISPQIGGSIYVITTPGTHTFYLKPTSGDATLYIPGSSFTGTIDNISVREVSGIHLTQGTTANKPLLRRGLTNLLTYSSDFSNAAWVAEGTASKVGNVLNTPASHGDSVYRGTLLPAGTYTNAFVLSGSGTISLFCYNPTDNIFAVKQITLTATPTIYVNVASPTVANNVYYFGRRTGDTATSVTFGGGGLFQGTLTASQILAAGGIPTTTTAAASNPDAGRYSWAFDGSDYIATSAPAFQVTDDSCVIAGANCTDVSAAYRIVVNPAGNTADNYSAGAICFEMTTGKLFSSYSIATGSTVLMSAVNDTNTPLVVSTRAVGNTRTLRKNAVVQQTTTVALGSSTYTSGSVGSNTGGSYGSRFHGTLGPVLTIKGTVTDAELLMYERLVAALTPGAPTF